MTGDCHAGIRRAGGCDAPPPDRLAMQPRPSTDLSDRNTVDPVQPPNLYPLLHADYPLSSPIEKRSNEGPAPAGRPRPRARWVTFRRAQVGHYSVGAHRPSLPVSGS